MRVWWLVALLLGCGRVDFDPHADARPADASIDAPSTGCFKQIAGGNIASCVLRDSGTVSCSGNNGTGALGVGMSVGAATMPVEVSALDSIEMISGGSSHFCALRAGGGVLCWGNNQFGSVGNGTTTNQFTPLQVAALTSPMVGVEVGNDHACAWDGSTVWCWGDNAYRQVSQTSPIPTVTPAMAFGGAVEVVGGGAHTCARKATGEVWCWGRNDFGQLGDGTTMVRNAPVQVMVGPVIDLSAGMENVCARDVDEHVWCWGSDQFGQLGDGNIAQGNPVPQQIAGLVATSISCGEKHCCAARHDGSVACWGSSDDNQLGVPGVTMSAVPIDVGGVPYAVEVTASDESSPQFRDYTCARTVDGVWCWGDNTYGEIGLGSTTSAPVPTRTPYSCP
ncbi:MAG TPA: hypothetical protein VL326_09630 [Kofleriaceae bacterium]|nr:hypothetical protein [Kofleriaceae bacterium]